jgi:hypothetical protein
MHYLKTIFPLLVLICIQFVSAAQKAKYAYTGYNMQIAGMAGNNIHVWSASAEDPYRNLSNITLTLQIFSPDMHLTKEKKIELGKINSWSIDFKHDSNFYYANITCISNADKRLLLKVDQDGNINDVSDIPVTWTTSFNTDEKNRYFTIVRKNSNMFFVDIENAKTGPGNDGNITFLPGENFKPDENYQKILIKKINIKTLKSTQVILGSGYKKFYYPLITVTDTAILVSALSEQGHAGKNNNESFMLLARLDTNVTQAGLNHVFLRPTNTIKNEIYSPLRIFEMENNVLILSKGLYNKQTVNYFTENQNGINIAVPMLYSAYITNSLKITIIDEKNNWLKDTIIENQGNNKNLELDNFFTVESGKGIDLFCSRKYGANKKGITHFRMNAAGNFKEEDMIVNVRYDYFMPDAKNLAPGTVLIPFAYRGKRGLMKLEYEPAE